MPKMAVSSVHSMLAAEKADALAAITSAQLTEDRADAMSYYLNDVSKDMPAQDGRSRAVSSDVADTIEGLMPSLMDIFCGSDEVVRFEPVGPEDEDAAQQETDYVNHVFMQQNPGFMTLYAFVKDALLSKVGIVKIWWEEREEEQRETYLDQSEDAFAIISQQAALPDSGLEIVEHTVNDKDGAVTHDVTVQTTKKIAQARVMGVPPEEFGIERGARSIADCNYCFHEVVTKTEAQLITEGFDEEQVKALGDYTGNTEPESLARDTVQEHSSTSSGVNSAARLVKITEHYVRMDYEGNGRPCLYQVTTGGDQGEILKKDGELSVVRYDAIPFAATTPVPVTHRFFGRSMADLVMDIMRIKTALLRGALDNLYLHNNPRVEVPEPACGENTLDDLLVSRQGGIVRTKVGGMLQWQTVPDITASVYPALEYMDLTREMRTGVSRQSQGVDANALQNQSATAVNQAFSASQARMKLIARIMAEGVRDIFALLHATIRKHGQEASTVRLRNSWVQVDPRNWRTRNDMTINVGLGTGGKAEQFAHTMALANFQKELVLGGKTNIVDDSKLYNTASELARLLGHKGPDKFFNDPAATNPQTGQLMHPPPQPPVDPKLIELKVKGQQQQVQAQIDQQAAQTKAQIEQLQAQADIATQDRKTQAEMTLAQQKAALEAQLMREQHEMKLAELSMQQEAHRQKMAHEEQLHGHAMRQAEFAVIAAQQTHEHKLQQADAKPRAGQ